MSVSIDIVPRTLAERLSAQDLLDLVRNPER
jgi:hypothetical protein